MVRSWGLAAAGQGLDCPLHLSRGPAQKLRLHAQSQPEVFPAATVAKLIILPCFVGSFPLDFKE